MSWWEQTIYLIPGQDLTVSMDANTFVCKPVLDGPTTVRVHLEVVQPFSPESVNRINEGLE